MIKMIVGSIAILLGLTGVTVFFPAFLTILSGTIPILLIMGGCLAIYLWYDSDSQDLEEAAADHDDISSSDTNIDKPPTEPKQEKATQDVTKPEDIEKAENQPAKPESVQTAAKDTNTSPPDADQPKLVGNTGSLVFHLPDCKFSKSKNCTAFFGNREEAIQQGYKPCGICSP